MSNAYSLETVVAFLCGEGPLDGLWFGDSDTDNPRPRYWWRKHLRDALSQPAAVERSRCEYGDGTGDVYNQSGEWGGKCHCVVAPTPPSAPVQQRAEDGFDEWWRSQDLGLQDHCFEHSLARAAYRAALSTSPLLDKNDQAEGENNVTLDKRDLFDFVRAAIIDALESAGRLNQPRSHIYEEAYNRTASCLGELYSNPQPDSNEVVGELLSCADMCLMKEPEEFSQEWLSAMSFIRQRVLARIKIITSLEK